MIDQKSRVILKSFSESLSKYKLHLAIGFMFMLLFTLFNLSIPVAMKFIIDSIVESVSKKDIPQISEFVLVGIVIVLLFSCRGGSYFMQNYFMHSLGQRMLFDLRSNLFNKIVKLPFSFFHRQKTGDLISRFTSDMQVIDQAIYVAATGPIRDFPSIIGLFGILLYTNPSLFLISLIMIPPTAWMINTFGKLNKSITERRQERFGELTSSIGESITGIAVVKAFIMEEHEKIKFKKINESLLKYYLKNILINSYSSPLIELVGAIAGSIILVYGGYQIITDQTSAGEFAQFILAFFMLNDPIKKFNGFNLKLQEGLAAAKRIFEILNEENKIIENNKTKELGPIQDKITIDIKSFSYTEHDKSVLDNVLIEIKAGQIVALVGGSGSGKSTIASLLPRFFDLTKEQGSIKVDNHDIRDIDVYSLRKQIAIVTQDTILFNDTVKNNIKYGNPHCSDQQLKEAAELANADQFIAELPKKYDQDIGEKGVLLSGGQKQRLAIARAVIKDAPILILDEATSSLDSVSESDVQSALDNLMKNRTSLVIAHRFTTIQHADLIYVLKNGKIVEQGNHCDLLASKGEYYKLYEIQNLVSSTN